jgi:hypothetical protein
MHNERRNGIAVALALTGAIALGASSGAGCLGNPDGSGGSGGGTTGTNTGGTGSGTSSSGNSSSGTNSSGSGSTTSSNPSSSSGATPECVVPEDCAVANECSTPTCTDGICGITFVPSGTVVGNEPLGDCKQAICDGAGKKSFIANDMDLPDDKVECTTDTCDAGVPVHTAKAMNSFCGPNGAHFCHADTDCKPCKELSAACEEVGPGEPGNAMQLTAHNFGTISDADSAGKDVCAVLSSPSDVDWYTYSGVDNAFSVVDPSRKVDAEAKTRLCVYLACTAGTTTFSCPAGSVPDTAPLGQQGCCSNLAISLSFDCNGVTDDDANVWLKVENPDQLACVPYLLSFHY